ncbi:MAG: CbtB-domain containing protein [Mariprofundales bacterium]|nr:CbtB-domain containing protein [Mariprofundales bacterium]
MISVVKNISVRFSVAVWVEALLWLSWVPLVLFTLFFSSIPDIHDGMHPLRHSTTIVQCH